MDFDSDPGGARKLFKSGFVAIVGAPNAGKSTLLNSILGEKVAITTPKPQTTRHQIKGILTGENFQAVFIDTPGIHASKGLLNRVIVRSATQALDGVDLVLFVVDVTRRNRGAEFRVLDLLEKVKKPVLLVLNKIDQIARDNLLPMMAEFHEHYPFDTIVPISAKYMDGVDLLLDEILARLPEGPQYYDGTVITDQPEDMMISELIREKIFLLAEKEIPYSTTVKVESMEEAGEKRPLTIHATIYVERPSQKRIIIGKNGKFIKKAGQMARQELENLWDQKVYLDLWVKVMKNWSHNERALQELGITGMDA